MVVGKEGGECEIFFALLLGQRYFEIKYLLPLHRQWRSSGSRHTYIYGVLAHLARARHWQCRGERFESAILHREEYRQACLRSSLIPKDPYLPNGDLGIRRGGFNSKDTSVYVA